METHALDYCEQLRAQGHTPHYIPVSGTTPHSCLGYVSGAIEMLNQLEDQEISLDGVYTPFGTGGIFTAMLLTFRENGVDAPFFGVSVNRPEEVCHRNLTHWWDSLCQLLDQKTDSDKGSYSLTDAFIGREYGDPTAACLDAILTLAETEGILLDPVYSGKVFSAFLAHCQAGQWKEGDNVMLVHSGGVPALFAYHEAIEAHLQKRNRL